MYLGDRHINFDRYYDAPDYNDEPETEEEIAAAQAVLDAEKKELDEAEAKWKTADCKCKCGRHIEFAAYFWQGICDACYAEGYKDIYLDYNENSLE